MIRIRSAVSLLALSLTLAGCGDDPITVPDGIGITGTWTFVVDVTTALGACAGEENDPVDTVVVAIAEFANGEVQANSTWFADAGATVFTGSRTGSSVTFTGNYTEDGGLTEATYNLSVNTDETLMDGTEDWTWNDTVCPGGVSQVTATRN